MVARKDGDLGSWGCPPPRASLTLKASPGGTAVATVPVTGAELHLAPIDPLPCRDLRLLAAYSGDANYDPVTSNVVTLTVVADIVDAIAEVQYSTFYPVKDGYRDTVRISGYRYEEAFRVKLDQDPQRVGQEGSPSTCPKDRGRSAFAWNGCSASGSVLPAGTYRLSHTFDSEDGGHLVVHDEVRLSTKRPS